MFQILADKILAAVDKIRGVTRVRDDTLQGLLRELRLALLEADVHVQVVKDFLAGVAGKVEGIDWNKSLAPAEVVLKVVGDEMVRVLTAGPHQPFPENPPTILLLVGLQGSGKTTTAAKLARWYMKQGLTPFLIPADTSRPAAIEQLKILAGELGLTCFSPQSGDDPVQVVARGCQAKKQTNAAWTLIDTAGRLHVDDHLLAELVQIHKVAAAVDGNVASWLVLDAMTGQEALAVARTFHQALGLQGVILTKIDGDARGGAALSLTMTVGCPILFLGVGERSEDLERFAAERLVSRLLDRGDFHTLIATAAEKLDLEVAQQSATRILHQGLTLLDFKQQIQQMKKLGSLGGLIKCLPGARKLTQGLDMNLAETKLKKKAAILDSMTPAELAHPQRLGASRKQRIAKGSGTLVSDVNHLLREFEVAQKMMQGAGEQGLSQLLRGGKTFF